MDRNITQDDVRELVAAGYSIVDDKTIGEARHVTVADPVVCLGGGGKRWTEAAPVTLHSRSQVSRFINARS